MKLQGLAVHGALLVGSIALAVYVWTRDQKAVAAVAAGDVIVWQGKGADVRRIAFEGKAKKIVLEAKSDEGGRWFAGESVTTPASVDGGAPASSKTTAFVSVASGEKIAGALAPLHASRDLGKLDGDRAADFGLAEPEGTVTVTIGDAQHTALVGAPAPGAQDRYLRESTSGEVYVVKADVLRDLITGETALIEKDAHGFKDIAVERIRVSAQGKSREMLRKGPEGKRIWADPKDPDKADETVGNWMGKVDRLRPTEFEAKLSPLAQLVVRIDYTLSAGTSTTPAFFELDKVPAPASDAKPDYYMRTERTRQWTKVSTSTGEQVEQDVGSVVP